MYYGENVDKLTVERRQSKFFQSNTFCRLIVVECHVQAVVSAIVFVQCPTTYHLQTVQRDVVHVAGKDQHVAGHLADMSQERHVVAGVRQEHQFQIAVDIGAVGVACSVLFKVAFAVTRTRRCATTYCYRPHTELLTNQTLPEQPDKLSGGGRIFCEVLVGTVRNSAQGKVQKVSACFLQVVQEALQKLLKFMCCRPAI